MNNLFYFHLFNNVIYLLHSWLDGYFFTNLLHRMALLTADISMGDAKRAETKGCAPRSWTTDRSKPSSSIIALTSFSLSAPIQWAQHIPRRREESCWDLEQEDDALEHYPSYTSRPQKKWQRRLIWMNCWQVWIRLLSRKRRDPTEGKA